MSKLLSDFTGKFSVNKTLRFALKPQGKTAQHIKEKGLLLKDEERAKKYQQAKQIIDEYHKGFIDANLSSFKFKKADLTDFHRIRESLKQPEDKADESRQKAFAQKQDALRKQVAKQLKGGDLFKKKFIKETLPGWLKEHSPTIEGVNNPDAIIEDFAKWTTYFTGFNDNRKNIYTSEEKSTAVGYRLVHDNLPKFLDNLERYNEAIVLGVDFSKVKGVLDDYFTLAGFNKCLTQSGIEQYNLIIGGKSQKGNKKQQGLNEKINLHAQQLEKQLAKSSDEEKKDLKSQIKKVRSCRMESLYKQILSDRNTASFRSEPIQRDAELCERVTNVINNMNSVRGKVKKCVNNLRNANPRQIYIKNDRALTDISMHLFGDWNIINNCLTHYAETEKFSVSPGKKETDNLIKQREAWLKQSYFSFADIHYAMQVYFARYSEDELQHDCAKESNDGEKSIAEQKVIATRDPLFGYFEDMKTRRRNKQTNRFEEKDLFGEIEQAQREISPVLDKYKDVQEEKLKGQKNTKGNPVAKIKRYLDTLMDLQHFLKPLFIQLSKKDEKRAEAYAKDGGFYSEYDTLYEYISPIIGLYNQVRNYLTKKPYSVEKFKLNFENQTLASGWDQNKEEDNKCVLFIKDEQYFLAIMDKQHKKLFKGALPDDGECYQKMIYKLLPGANKMLPKVFFAESNIDYYSPSDRIKAIRNHASYAKNGTSQEGYEKRPFSPSDMRKIVDFYKESIAKHTDWKQFGFKFSPTRDYEDISDFYKEVEQQGYNLRFVNVSENYIHQCVDEGKLYLFEIYTKDFSSKTRGLPNLQTIYWRALFETQNLKNVVYQLNGEAELFHRRASISYNDKIKTHGHHTNDPKKKQDYPIIKDRRYTQDTFLFHVPITCNFKTSQPVRFNDEVNKFLKNNPAVNIIGIDRGERHLAYYTVINQQGEIIKDKKGKYLQDSFNNPFGKKDYHNLLDDREKERNKARRSWGTIERIKDLKTGYLSQVVHQIAKLMIEHNAIVVFEDLNFGFKKGRFKIEKQVYQKLEKALIDKLNYLVFKDKDAHERGGPYKALQLTNRFEGFQKIGKQTGFIFYVPAYHTSKLCPATGFVNLLNTRYETVTKAKEFFNKFKKICFNRSEGYFEFHLNYEDFTTRAEGGRLHWVVCSHGTRLENYRNKNLNHQWNTRKVNLSEDIQSLFREYAVDDFEDEHCLIQQIIQQDSKDFFYRLMRLLKLTLQLRNSRTGTDEDWMVSPVKDKSGKFFDSRKSDGSMPRDADANGAYHIALKGLMILEQLGQQKNETKFKPDLSNKVWYKRIQTK